MTSAPIPAMKTMPSLTRFPASYVSPRFRKIRIGVLGDLMLDRYLWGTATACRPKLQFPSLILSRKRIAWGRGKRCRQFACLGRNVEMFGVIGATKTRHQSLSDDEAGRVLTCLPA